MSRVEIRAFLKTFSDKTPHIFLFIFVKLLLVNSEMALNLFPGHVASYHMFKKGGACPCKWYMSLQAS